jgi:hypothetical protein
VGKVKKTHVRIPINSKKKELNRQAAVAVNTVVNSTRVASKLPQPVKKSVDEQGSRPLTAQRLTALTPTAVKIVKPATDFIMKAKKTSEEKITNLRPIGQFDDNRLPDMYRSGSDLYVCLRSALGRRAT